MPEDTSLKVYWTLGRFSLIIGAKYSGISFKCLVSSQVCWNRLNSFLICLRLFFVTCFFLRCLEDTPFSRQTLRMVLGDKGTFSKTLICSAPMRLYLAFNSTRRSLVPSGVLRGEWLGLRDKSRRPKNLSSLKRCAHLRTVSGWA